MNERLLSLSCSGESLEKVLTLYYHALLSAPDFYNSYKVILFYGNNLPKKDCTLAAHGTAAFYDRYFKQEPYLPPCSREYLWTHAKEVVHQLVYTGHLTGRQGDALLGSPERFWSFVRNIPISVLYPNFMSALIKKAMEELAIFSLRPLYLERNYYKVLSKIKDNAGHYSIYALEADGTIGTYYLHPNNEHDTAHLYSELARRPVLSGNSGLLIHQIANRIGSHTTVGYRVHKKRIRSNREHALSYLLEGRNRILEPKNYYFTTYYHDLDPNLSDEEKSIEAFAAGYRRFLNECVRNWNIDPHQDVLAKGGKP